MDEIWKWVEGYEGLYQISNMGRLKSFHKNKDGEIISLRRNDDWYIDIGLYKDGKGKHIKAHILVAKTFIGEIPKGYHVHHKDGNKQNNCVENLEIIHPSKHREETLKVKPQIVEGMRHYNKYKRPKPINMYDLDGNYLATFPNTVIAGQITGVCSRNILQVAKQETYGDNGRTRHQAGGYIWKFKEVEGGD